MYLKGSVSGWGMEMDGLNFPIHFGSLHFYGRGIEMDKELKWLEHRRYYHCNIPMSNLQQSLWFQDRTLQPSENTPLKS